MENKNKTLKWLHTEMAGNIHVDDRIQQYCPKLRGIYGIFVQDDTKRCVYVGRSSNIYRRMFGGDGHITNLMKGFHTNPELKEAMQDIDNKKISIEILKEVPFQYDDYYKDMQRLASAENSFIDQFQNMDQCLHQVPEGTAMAKKIWDQYKKHHDLNEMDCK